MLFRSLFNTKSKLCLELTNTLIVRNLSQSNKAVGFIGLGNMGANMAQSILKNKQRLVVYDINPNATAALAIAGAEAAKSPAELARQCDKIITMLPTGAHVNEVYTGDYGILKGVQRGTYLLDSSTIDSESSVSLSKLAQEKGAVFLDTPVTGAVPAARAGTLTFLVGGQAKDVDAIRDVLLFMGKNVVHCGPVGSGSAAKICNNMCLAITMIGTSETLNLAKKLGLDPKLMTQILNISSGRSWTTEVYNPVPGVMENVPSSNDYKGGFMTQLMTKDMNLAQAAATRVNAPTPMGTLTHQIYRFMLNNGWGEKDFSSVYKFLQDANEKTL